MGDSPTFFATMPLMPSVPWFDAVSFWTLFVKECRQIKVSWLWPPLPAVEWGEPWSKRHLRVVCRLARRLRCVSEANTARRQRHERKRVLIVREWWKLSSFGKSYETEGREFLYRFDTAIYDFHSTLTFLRDWSLFFFYSDSITLQ